MIFSLQSVTITSGMFISGLVFPLSTIGNVILSFSFSVLSTTTTAIVGAMASRVMEAVLSQKKEKKKKKETTRYIPEFFSSSSPDSRFFSRSVSRSECHYWFSFAFACIHYSTTKTTTSMALFSC